MRTSFERFLQNAFSTRVQNGVAFQILLDELTEASGLEEGKVHDLASNFAERCWSVAKDAMLGDNGPLDAVELEVNNLKQRLLRCNLSATTGVAAARAARHAHGRPSIEVDAVCFHESLTHLDDETRNLVCSIVLEKLWLFRRGIAPPSLVEALQRYAAEVPLPPGYEDMERIQDQLASAEARVSSAEGEAKQAHLDLRTAVNKVMLLEHGFKRLKVHHNKLRQKVGLPKVTGAEYLQQITDTSEHMEEDEHIERASIEAEERDVNDSGDENEDGSGEMDINSMVRELQNHLRLSGLLQSPQASPQSPGLSSSSSARWKMLEESIGSFIRTKTNSGPVSTSTVDSKADATARLGDLTFTSQNPQGLGDKRPSASFPPGAAMSANGQSGQKQVRGEGERELQPDQDLSRRLSSDASSAAALATPPPGPASSQAVGAGSGSSGGNALARRASDPRKSADGSTSGSILSTAADAAAASGESQMTAGSGQSQAGGGKAGATASQQQATEAAGARTAGAAEGGAAGAAGGAGAASGGGRGGAGGGRGEGGPGGGGGDVAEEDSGHPAGQKSRGESGGPAEARSPRHTKDTEGKMIADGSSALDEEPAAPAASLHVPMPPPAVQNKLLLQTLLDGVAEIAEQMHIGPVSAPGARNEASDSEGNRKSKGEAAKALLATVLRAASGGESSLPGGESEDVDPEVAKHKREAARALLAVLLHTASDGKLALPGGTDIQALAAQGGRALTTMMTSISTYFPLQEASISSGLPHQGSRSDDNVAATSIDGQAVSPAPAVEVRSVGCQTEMSQMAMENTERQAAEGRQLKFVLKETHGKAKELVDKCAERGIGEQVNEIVEEIGFVAVGKNRTVFERLYADAMAKSDGKDEKRRPSSFFAHCGMEEDSPHAAAASSKSKSIFMWHGEETLAAGAGSATYPPAQPRQGKALKSLLAMGTSLLMHEAVHRRQSRDGPEQIRRSRSAAIMSSPPATEPRQEAILRVQTSSSMPSLTPASEQDTAGMQATSSPGKEKEDALVAAHGARRTTPKAGHRGQTPTMPALISAEQDAAGMQAVPPPGKEKEVALAAAMPSSDWRLAQALKQVAICHAAEAAGVPANGPGRNIIASQPLTSANQQDALFAATTVRRTTPKGLILPRTAARNGEHHQHPHIFTKEDAAEAFGIKPLRLRPRHWG